MIHGLCKLTLQTPQCRIEPQPIMLDIAAMVAIENRFFHGGVAGTRRKYFEFRMVFFPILLL